MNEEDSDARSTTIRRSGPQFSSEEDGEVGGVWIVGERGGSQTKRKKVLVAWCTDPHTVQTKFTKRNTKKRAPAPWILDFSIGQATRVQQELSIDEVLRLEAGFTEHILRLILL